VTMAKFAIGNSQSAIGPIEAIGKMNLLSDEPRLAAV
jgi:hypothetical protein